MFVAGKTNRLRDGCLADRNCLRQLPGADKGKVVVPHRFDETLGESPFGDCSSANFAVVGAESSPFVVEESLPSAAHYVGVEGRIAKVQ